MRFSIVTYAWLIAAFGLLLVSPRANSQPWPGSPAPRVPSLAFAWFGAAGGSYLGVGAVEIDPERAKALKLRENRGVELTCIEDGSPAAEAGLRVGDIVLRYGGDRIEDMERLSRLVRKTPVGRRVKLVISRGGATMTVSAVIGSRAAPAPDGFRALDTAFPNLDIPGMPALSQPVGLEIEALSPQLAGFFGVKTGVLVGSVLPQSPAESAGIRAGDVILRIGGAQTGTPAELVTALNSRSKNRVPVVVMRKRHEKTLQLNLDGGRPVSSR